MATFRRSGSCETIEDSIKPGWAKTVDGAWLAVVNTHEYPQEVKTVSCESEGEDCAMMYSRTHSMCEQKKVRRKMMVVDPRHPEKGVFSEAFDIPTECACAVQRMMTFTTAKPKESSDKGVDKYYGMIRHLNVGRTFYGSSFPEMPNPDIQKNLPPLRTRDPYSTSRARMKPKRFNKHKHRDQDKEKENVKDPDFMDRDDDISTRFPPPVRKDPFERELQRFGEETKRQIEKQVKPVIWEEEEEQEYDQQYDYDYGNYYEDLLDETTTMRLTTPPTTTTTRRTTRRTTTRPTTRPTTPAVPSPTAPPSIPLYNDPGEDLQKSIEKNIMETFNKNNNNGNLDGPSSSDLGVPSLFDFTRPSVSAKGKSVVTKGSFKVKRMKATHKGPQQQTTSQQPLDVDSTTAAAIERIRERVPPTDLLAIR